MLHGIVDDKILEDGHPGVKGDHKGDVVQCSQLGGEADELLFRVGL